MIGLHETKLASTEVETKTRILVALKHKFTAYYGTRNQHNPAQGGVAIFIAPDFPGGNKLKHLRHYDIAGRYMVLRTQWRACAIL